jgi:hypothetical protein
MLKIIFLLKFVEIHFYAKIWCIFSTSFKSYRCHRQIKKSINRRIATLDGSLMDLERLGNTEALDIDKEFVNLFHFYLAQFFD